MLRAHSPFIRASSIILLLSFAGLPAISSLPTRETAPEPLVRIRRYSIDVRIDPGSSYLAARAHIEGEALGTLGPELEFFLNEELRLTGDHTRRAGGEIALPFSPSGSPASVVLPSQVEAGGEVAVDISYEGILQGAGLYRISPRLTELSRYAAWFPLPAGSEEFSYEMTVDLPEAYSVVSAGEVVSVKADAGRRMTRFRGTTVARDLLLIASDEFQLRNEGTLSIHDLELTDEQADRIFAEAQRVVSLYTERYGPPLSGESIRFVVVPRPGGSYVRPPVIVLESRPVVRWAASVEKDREEFHRLAHELAHLYWPWADSSTSDDWLNEGLAEFSALLASGERFGPDHERQLVRAARLRVLGMRQAASIRDTLRTDKEAEVLFYDKAALIIRMLEAMTASSFPSDRKPFLDALRSYRHLRNPTAMRFASLMAEHAGTPLGPFLDTWLGAERFPRLSMDLVEVRPAGDPEETVELTGSIMQEPEMLNGFPVTIRATSRDRDHDFRIRLEGEATRFDVRLPFFPDDLILDPDLLVLAKDRTFRLDLLETARRDRVDGLIAEGLGEEERRHFQAALMKYRQAAGIDPTNMVPLYRMGRVYALLGDPELSLKYHREAVAAGQDDADLRSWNQVRIGQMLDLLGKRREARKAYREALGMPDYAGAHEQAHRGLEKPHRP